MFSSRLENTRSGPYATLRDEPRGLRALHEIYLRGFQGYLRVNLDTVVNSFVGVQMFGTGCELG